MTRGGGPGAGPQEVCASPGTWREPLSSLKGIGPAREEALRRRGLRTLQDLLLLLPTRYRLPAPLLEGEHLPAGERVALAGVVRSRRRGRLRKGRGYLEVVLEAACGPVPVRFYNQPFLFDRFASGDRLLVSGRTSAGGRRVLAVEDHWRLDKGGPGGLLAQPLPVHPVVPGIPPRTLVNLVARARRRTRSQPDPLPGAVRRRCGLPELHEALERVHRPTAAEDVAPGARRLLFDRFLALMFPAQAARPRRPGAPSIRPGARVLARIRRRFPFTFTPGQEAALEEILRDLAGPRAMRRLLQGDVGSGKTAVALAAALAVVATRRQVLLLAPTGVLAAQHHRVLRELLSGSRVRHGLLTAGTPAPEARHVRADLQAGDVDILVATHAALDPRVRLRHPGLVIIDEQHRFGVRQRLAASAGHRPHLLSMSATPIPRSLCLALMGDLDHTVVRGRPGGRGPVATKVTGMRSAMDAVRAAVQARERAFVVLPAVEAEELPAVEREGRDLAAADGPLQDVPCVFLHGRMPAREREVALDAFRGGRAAVLVATVMVEVGLDVPEATVMAVLGAERFGLAALHQLRGRVGRGRRPGRCLLVPGRGAPREARRRLAVLEREDDGFAIAEQDLLQRGPGELVGFRQAGPEGPFGLAAGADRELFDAAWRAARALHRRGWDWSAGGWYPGIAQGAGFPVASPEEAV